MNNTKKIRCPGVALYMGVLKRSLWVPLVLSILNVVIISFTAGSYRFYRGVRLDPLKFSDLASALNSDFVIFFLTVAISALIGCVVFSYLNKVSSACFIHGLPVGRTEIFFAHFLAGVSMIAIPAVVSAIYMSIHVSSVAYGLLFLGVYLLYGIGSFSFAVLVSQLCANTLGSLIFTVFGLASPLICEGFILYLINENLYGYAGTYDGFTVSRLLYLEPRLVASAHCLVYIFAIAMFTLFALLLFSRRAIELAGDLIAFGGMRKAAVYVCGLLAGMCAYLIFGGSLFMFLLFGLICAVLVNFAVRKKFTVRGAITPCVTVVATAIFIAALFHFDLTGFERRVPDIDDVESVRFYNRFYNNTHTSVGNKIVRLVDFHAPITDKDEIGSVINLHKELIGNKHYYSSNGHSKSYTLEYTLKNGKTLERKYIVYLDRNFEAFKPVSELYGFKRHTHDLLEPNINLLRAELKGLYGNTVSIDKAEDVKRLYDAVVKDVANMKLEHDHDLLTFRSEPQLSLRIYHYPAKAVYEDGTPVPNALMAESETRSDLERIYPCYTNTLAVIKDIAPELLDTSAELPGPSYLTVQYSKQTLNNTDGFVKVEAYEEVEFTDPDIIREVIKEGYALSDERFEKGDSGTSYYLHFNIDNRYYFDFRVQGESELLKKYVMSKNPKLDGSTVDYYMGDIPYDHEIFIETSSSYYAP